MKTISSKEAVPTIEEILIIGKRGHQIDLKIANASGDVLNYLKLTKGTEVGIMSYDFPKEEWNDAWLEWLLYQENKNKVRFRVMGGPKIQAQEKVDQLCKENIIELRLRPSLETFHVLYVKDPKQLWIEQYHMTRPAYGVHYTDNPLESAWTEMLKYFTTLWDASDPYMVK